MRLHEFSDLIADLGERSGLIAWDQTRLIILSPSEGSALPPPAAAPGPGTSVGRGGSLSRSVCACGQETLATDADLLNLHRCEEGS